MESYQTTRGKLVNQGGEEVAAGAIELTTIVDRNGSKTYEGELAIETCVSPNSFGPFRLDLSSGQSVSVVVTERNRRVLHFTGSGDFFATPQS